MSNRAAAFSSDEPLEPGQAEKLRVTAMRIGRTDRVVASPEASAWETAIAITAETTDAPQVAEALRDIDYGRWSKLRLMDVATAEPDALASLFRDPTVAPHGGETLASAAGRVRDWMETARTIPGHSLVVTHPTLIKLAVLSVLDAPLQGFTRLDIGFLSVTRFSTDGGRWSLRI